MRPVAGVLFAGCDVGGDVENVRDAIAEYRAPKAAEKCGFRVVRQGKHLTLLNGAATVQVPRCTSINDYTMGPLARCAGLSAVKVCAWR